MTIIKGLGGIEVKIIADSLACTFDGKRLTTFELTYPRIIHGEFMTHRVFSRNAMSSRAVPVKTMLELVRKSPAMPVRFGANQPGMQDKGEEFESVVSCGYSGRDWWKLAALSAARFAEELSDAGFHKQLCNRLIEPFQMMKTVMTTTEMANFEWLRLDADADPTFEELAKCIMQAYRESSPETLYVGEWHTPYVKHKRNNTVLEYYVEDIDGNEVILTLEEAKSISSSCCAQVSYRRLNATKDKALDIYSRLLDGRKVHASPFEHQATPMQIPDSTTGEDVFATLNRFNGYTHVDKLGKFWSGNLCGWIQHRQLLKNHNKIDF